jgi:plasmid stabilization system protein ParE
VKVYFSKKAESGLDEIFSHVVENLSFEQAQIVRNELVTSILKIGDFPEIGSKLAGQSDKRVLFVSGNAIVYEIALTKEPYILIRNIKPRRTA